jgi:hypothetical protein
VLVLLASPSIGLFVLVLLASPSIGLFVVLGFDGAGNALPDRPRRLTLHGCGALYGARAADALTNLRLVIRAGGAERGNRTQRPQDGPRPTNPAAPNAETTIVLNASSNHSVLSEYSRATPLGRRAWQS